MSGTKKRKNEERDPTYFTRKKNKDSKESTDEPENDPDEFLVGNLLDKRVIREGMLVLGCVIEINKTYLVMSLPGYLSGRVHLNNISNVFTKILESSCDTSLPESSVHTYVKVGMVFPCKVLQISQDVTKRRPLINLSINPEDVNAEVKPRLLIPKMVLYVTVCSVEDHGYVVDVGIKNIKGFLTRQGSEDEVLKIGEVRPACIKKINYSNIQLSKLDFNGDFPEITEDDLSHTDVTLSSFLPGNKIVAEVIKIEYPFIYMDYSAFHACACILYLGSSYKSITIGSRVTGTVLYVDPISRMIYVMLSMKPSPELFAGYFGLKKYEMVKTLKYQYMFASRVYYKIDKGTIGFIHMADMPTGWDSRSLVLGKISPVTEACVYQLHFMDNVVQLSTKSDLKTFISLEDVKIGEVYDATVVKHLENGMFVKIGHGLNGFIRRIFMSDVFVTKPEVLYPVGKIIKCRVLGKDNKDKLIMTCKKSLVHLPEQWVLSSYDKIKYGQRYYGVIGKICKQYILIIFFNQIKGIVLPPCIPKRAVFFEGQTVFCEVERFNPLIRELILSIKVERSLEIDIPSEKSCSEVNTGKGTGVCHQSEKIEKATVLSKQSEEIISNHKFDCNKPVEARILNIKGSQMLVYLCDYDVGGRVHITNLGCVTENIYPLREFSVRQEIQVYVVGEILKKKSNFLSVTHQNFVYMKECSLNPSSVSLTNDLHPGSSLIGFVKKVYKTYAVLWLTPSKIGILDYLHFSEHLQVVKKLHRQLKVGMSLKVSVLENQVASKSNKGKNNVILTKIDFSVPEVGKNVMGLMQVANLEKGLSLKLPFNYHGFVAVTDLTDVYMPVQTLFDRFQNLKYLLCHVLEVNHETRTCQLSLRKSRVYGNKLAGGEFCPEVTLQNIKEGLVVKGFVKSISDTAITVTLGKNLEGKVNIHKCATSGCKECLETKSMTDKYTVGSVANVVVLKSVVGKKPCIVAFEDHRSLAENTDYDRINIDEEISWDEVD